MSILLQRKEYLNEVEKIYPLNEAQKKSAKLNNKNFKQTSFYHYRTNLGISYIFFNSTFKNEITMESKHTDNDASFIIFNSCAYNSKIQDFNNKNNYVFKANHYTVGKIDKDFKSFNTYKANKQYCTHYILFENKIFKDLVKDIKEQNPLFKVNGFEIKHEIKIDEKQKLILDDLPNLFSLDGKLQELYLESKIIDLIYITISNIKKNSQKEDYSFSSKDTECLHKAKDILIKNFTNPPSLKSLAHQAAINEFKLKKGFKQIFGTTVYGFLQEYRLNEAKYLLENNEINIGEASSLVGYKSISHFSKIFKEQFGITPIEIKKEQKKIYIFNTSKMN